jgi:hypothetical protein
MPTPSTVPSLPAPAATASAPLPSSTPVATPALPRCRTGQLTVNHLGDSTGMGKAIELYGLRNDAPRRCSLRGYPTVRSFTDDGRPITFTFSGAETSEFGVPLPLATVVLEPMASARLQIGFGYVTCAVLHVPGKVLVTLPDDPEPLRLPDVPSGVALCSGESVWVSPVFDASIDPYRQPR